MRLIETMALRPARLGRLAIQVGLAFAIAMTAIGVIGFSLADHWVSSRIDQSLTYHANKYVSKVWGDPAADRHLQAAILEWQHRKVLSERTYVLFDRNGERIAGRLDIAPPPTGFSYLSFTGGGLHPEEGRALATRMPSGSLFVVVQHSEAAEGLHAILPMVVLTISGVALVLGVSATFLFARLTAKRLAETQDTAAAIAAGDLSRRVSTARLDGMFRVQAKSLNHMLDHMEELVRAQQLFSSNLAHDLRTPLTRLQSLLENASRDDRGDFASLLGQAERECASIINIFDALLRLAEIETGQHPSAMTPISLRPLIEDIADTMEPVIADRGGRLGVRRLDDVTITGDPDLINQLLINLLENVATHTPPGTSVSLALERSRDGATISVRDDGPGLATNEFARVTQPFERGSTVSSRNGSGLGLAIARAIARFHNGSLELMDAAPGLEVRIPGVGPVIATALVALAPAASTFRRGRDFAAWLGLVPRQHSSGGKERLGRTTKMGERSLRRLLIIGASAVTKAAARDPDKASKWLAGMLARKPRMLVTVAMANKMARTVWALMAHGGSYRAPAAAM